MEGGIKLGKSFSDLKPGKKDPALEKKILAAVQGKASSDGWKEQFSKVTISSTDWIVEKHPITDMPTGRVIDAWAYAKWPDGHCSYQSFSFYEEAVNGSFTGKVVWHGAGDQAKCDCQ